MSPRYPSAWAPPAGDEPRQLLADALGRRDRVWPSDCIDALERQQIQRFTIEAVGLELIPLHHEHAYLIKLVAADLNGRQL